MKSIVFLTPTLTQPRYFKRIKYFEGLGYKVKVFSFDRSLYKNNSLDRSFDVTVLDRIENRDYLKRLGKYRRSFGIIKDYIKSEKTNLIYIFGFDLCLFSLLLLPKMKIIYEVSDIPYLNSHKLTALAYTMLDRIMLKKIGILVLTSEGFYEHHYKKFMSRDHIVFIPNKLNEVFLSNERVPGKLSEGRIRFGFVGLLRPKPILVNFIESIGARKDKYELHFHGDGTIREDIIELTKKYDNVFYHGEFRNPDDLQDIYSGIDLSFACYYRGMINEMIAEPNKLYEAIYFCKPVVVSEGTFIGDKVRSLGVGYNLNANSRDEIEKFLDSLTRDSIISIMVTCKNIPVQELVTDQSELGEELSKL